jgi:tetratricopeptide (TPR) repeat protein
MEGRTVSHYTVLERLGRGGMGVVYRAEDRQLGRTVALKFLPVELDSAGPEARERFLREARAASGLDHPRICTVFEIGESDDGRPFIAMAYCAGQTLADRIRQGPVPCDEARAIAIQIAEGLAAAHLAGVVHRDVKPANIMLTPGGVKILDFGLAKLADVSHLTHTGATLGTPAYMSPEQATGGEVDARSDIWALGAILYEMLTGVRAFSGDNPTAIMFAILSHEVPPAAELRADAPDDLQRVIRRCLQKDPERRYRQIGELLVDLGADQRTLVLGASGMTGTGNIDSHGARSRSPRPGAGLGRRRLVFGAAGLLVAAALATGWWWIRSGEGGARPRSGAREEMPVMERAPLHVVGVVAFANRTGDAAFDWYGDGMARLVTDALAGSRLLHVVSGEALDRLRAGGDSGIEAAAAAAGMDALVMGEILPGPSGVTVAARVVDTASGRSLAARRVDGLGQQTLLGAVDLIAADARRGLGLPPEDSVDVYSADFVVDNPEAFRRYLEGLEAFADWRYQEAEQRFTEALALAPEFTMARYRLAWVYGATGRRAEALTEIRRAAAGSARLSDREARYVRAAEAEFEARTDDALAEYRALVEAYPYDSDARHLLAGVLHDSGRYDEEIAELLVLARLDPADAVVRSMLGYAHLAKGDYTSAVVDLQRYVEMVPDSANGHASLGDAYRAQGELDLAADEYRAALASDPGFHAAVSSLAVVEALEGRLDGAEQRLRSLVENEGALPRHRLDAVFELASVLRARGRFREAERVLASVEDELGEEQVREAMALAIRGSCLGELGDSRAARSLIERAIEQSPGVPTRYLMTRGFLELRLADLEAVRSTASELAEHALPPDNRDRTEDKAAAYLEGMALLAEGDTGRAVERLSLAVAAAGYEYSVYRVGLAQAFLAAGRLPEAMAAARQAVEGIDTADPRLDLLLDRARARLVLARVLEAMGRPDKAAAQASEFLALWRSADAGLPELAEARRLAGGAGEPAAAAAVPAIERSPRRLGQGSGSGAENAST